MKIKNAPPAATYEPRSLEPSTKIAPRPVKNGTGRHGERKPTSFADPQPLLSPDDVPIAIATRAPHSVRPPFGHEIRLAGVLC